MIWVRYGYQVKELLNLIYEMYRNILNLFVKPVALITALFPILFVS